MVTMSLSYTEIFNHLAICKAHLRISRIFTPVYGTFFNSSNRVRREETMSDYRNHGSSLAILQRLSGGHQGLASVRQVVQNDTGLPFYMPDYSVSNSFIFPTSATVENGEASFETIGDSGNSFNATSIGRNNNTRFWIFIIFMQPLQKKIDSTLIPTVLEYLNKKRAGKKIVNRNIKESLSLL